MVVVSLGIGAGSLGFFLFPADHLQSPVYVWIRGVAADLGLAARKRMNLLLRNLNQLLSPIRIAAVSANYIARGVAVHLHRLFLCIEIRFVATVRPQALDALGVDHLAAGLAVRLCSSSGISARHGLLATARPGLTV